MRSLTGEQIVFPGVLPCRASLASPAARARASRLMLSPSRPAWPCNGCAGTSPQATAVFGAFRNESGLNPIRSRPDFQLLLMDLAFPADPFVRRD